MSSALKSTSWVVKERKTGRVMFETFNRELVKRLNHKRYKAVPIRAHLAEFNRKVKRK